MSLCLAPPRELAFLIDPVGPGTRALCALAPGDQLSVFGPLGNGFRTDVEHPLLVGGGIGIAPLPYASEVMGRPPAILGFRTTWQAEAAALVPCAEVCVEPALVTDLLPEEPHDLLVCGPEPMLAAVRRLHPEAQLAWEAPMACGYGACYGCAVEIDGRLERLCIKGPVINGREPRGVTLAGDGVSTRRRSRAAGTAAPAGAETPRCSDLENPSRGERR
jgi:NAD(P)H-flavin reductase